MRPAAASASADASAVAVAPYPRADAHFDREAILSSFLLAFKAVEVREKAARFAKGLAEKAFVEAMAAMRIAAESFMVDFFSSTIM